MIEEISKMKQRLIECGGGEPESLVMGIVTYFKTYFEVFKKLPKDPKEPFEEIGKFMGLRLIIDCRLKPNTISIYSKDDEPWLN